jgi:hypothetical protein
VCFTVMECVFSKGVMRFHAERLLGPDMVHVCAYKPLSFVLPPPPFFFLPCILWSIKRYLNYTLDLVLTY